MSENAWFAAVEIYIIAGVFGAVGLWILVALVMRWVYALPGVEQEKPEQGQQRLLEPECGGQSSSSAARMELPRPSAAGAAGLRLSSATGALVQRVSTPQAWGSGRVADYADLAVMTLNLQYFASYPKDEVAARERLIQVLSGPAPPDVICVQEGLSSRNVLEAVDYELQVCSAREGFAQSVYDMVYGDEQTLKACDAATHQDCLCNQIYTRRGSAWEVADSGAKQVSSDLRLAGGGSRMQGKLAIRSMVWVKLRAAATPGLHTYVMCTHITGGRFEDQYFVQQLAEERRLQIDRVIDFFDSRPDPHSDDVGILVGDFNATTLYTPDGPMNAYFKMSIATSGGVKADAEAVGVVGEGALEGLFQDYMISPFAAFHHHGWTFAYDRQQVGYTSGFGHCIDHMAMSRSLQVRSAAVSYLTNQKLGGKKHDTEMPLTDHNSVKTVFRISTYQKQHTAVFRTEYDFLQYLRSYKALVHISGFGNKQQYADVDAVVEAVVGPLFTNRRSMDQVYGQGNWALCFGGDPLKEENTDLAVLVRRLQTEYRMPLIAIQADKVDKDWGGVDKHIDAVYYYPTDYMEDGDVAWGGFVHGKLVGTTRILLDVNPLSGVHLYWIAAGGGDITVGELQAAWERHIAILAVRARARHPQEPSSPFGPCGRFWESLTDYDEVHEDPSGFRRKRQ